MNALTHIPQDAKPIPAPGTSYQVVSTFCGAPGGARYTVMFDGRFFVVNKDLLESLKAGKTPDDLELEEAEGDE